MFFRFFYWKITGKISKLRNPYYFFDFDDMHVKNTLFDAERDTGRSLLYVSASCFQIELQVKLYLTFIAMNNSTTQF